MNGTWRVLSIGNSFSADTMELLPQVALSGGVERVVLGNLYIGGCSIRMHAAHAQADAAVYEYYKNVGEGWEMTPGHAIREILESEPWDVVSVQHGSGDGSLYTDAAYYEQLPWLVSYIRALAPEATVAFNMTWAGDADHAHSEIVRYQGDQEALYRDIVRTTRETVCGTKGIERVSPTGTAVQLARRLGVEALTRDGYHLSLDRGRYLAALTFFKTLTGRSLDTVRFAPDGVDAAVKKTLIEAAEQAVRSPFGDDEKTA